jgi:hypothetical protein
MNRTDFHNRATSQTPRWNDPPISSLAWGAETMAWETNLLLPQLAVALDHPCGAASANRLASLWRALRAISRHPSRRNLPLQAN